MAAKKKRLTQKEKKLNAQFKKEMQEKGIIPPDKPRLNRRKFVDDAMKEWNDRPQCYLWENYLIKAFGFIMAETERGSLTRVSQEAVGAAKVLKLAIRLFEFHMKLKDEGREKYTLKEQLDYIKDILDA